MIPRKIENELERFLNDTSRKALLLTGARQVGKTFSVRQFGKTHYKTFVEFNFIKNEEAGAIFRNVSDERDILLRLSAMANTRLIPGNTLIFFDEVQACPEVITFIKFLVEEGSYRYILSGSLLGVELKNIRSVPVGYMKEAQMFPLDFEEFIRANGVGDDVIEHLRDAWRNKRSPDPVIHEKMVFHSMPEGNVWNLYADLLMVPEDTEEKKEPEQIHIQPEVVQKLEESDKYKPVGTDELL